MSSRTLERIREAMPVAVDPRIQARRDEVDRQRQRRRRGWLLGVATVVVVVATGWFVTHSALLDIDEVRATATPHVSEQQLLDASGLRPGDHLVDVDPGAVRNRLLALPWVDDATVDVDWWGTVTLAVTERTPVAAISDGAGAFVLADATGRALTTLPVGADLGGAIIVDGVAPVAAGEQFGPALDAPLQVIAALTPGVRTRVLSVVPGADGSIDLHVHPQGSVQLCQPDDLGAKVRAMQTVFAHVDDTGLKVLNVCVPSDPRVSR
ncbi:MAG TPA: FtsQ-type POTRA domain-containing protein [Acidimicrobiales bacterium]